MQAKIKEMKKVCIILSLIVAILVTVSCSKDENKDNPIIPQTKKIKFSYEQFAVPYRQDLDSTIKTVIKSLIDSYTAKSEVDRQRIYMLGGSMGGTGTWSILSTYPNIFAAAMPAAGNPSRCDASNVATTPVFTVMGTMDKIMSIIIITVR